MTNREFYSFIINSDLNAEIKDFAKAEIDKLDARNAKRRDTLSPEQVANEGYKKQILEILVKPMVASEIASTLGLSTQKVSALCKQLVEGGSVKVADIKVKNKGTVKQYSVVEG